MQTFKKLPPKKNIVRGISYMTGHIIRPTSAKSCKFLYVTHSDPNGNLPAWLINTGTKALIPKVSHPQRIRHLSFSISFHNFII